MSRGSHYKMAMLVILLGMIYSAISVKVSTSDAPPFQDTTPGNFPVNPVSTGRQSQSTPDAISDDVTPDDISDDVAELIQEIKEITDESENLKGSKTGLAAASVSSDLKNCNLEPTLDRYCPNISLVIRGYFDSNLSVSNLLASFYKREVVMALQVYCTPGNFCLPNSFQKMISQEMYEYYVSSPFCTDEMFTCLENMRHQRYDCQEKDVHFLEDTVVTLCGLEDVDNLTPQCYQLASEAMYVTYVNMKYPASSPPPTTGQIDCNGYKGQLTKQLTQAMYACSDYQKSILEGFQPWEEIVEDADETAAACNITISIDDDSGLTTPVDDDGDKMLQEILKKIQEDEKRVGIAGSDSESEEDDDNLNAIGDNNNKALMFGLVVMTTVLIVGCLGLAVLVYKRFYRTRWGYDRYGYSKLTDEEARLLRGEIS